MLFFFAAVKTCHYSYSSWIQTDHTCSTRGIFSCLFFLFFLNKQNNLKGSSSFSWVTVPRALCIRGSSPDIYSLFSLPHTNQPHTEMQFSIVAQQESPPPPSLKKTQWHWGVRWAKGIKVHVPNTYPLVLWSSFSDQATPPAFLLFMMEITAQRCHCAVCQKKWHRFGGVGYTLSSSMKMIGQWSHAAFFFCSFSL